VRDNESKQMTHKQDYSHGKTDVDPNQLKLELSLLQKKYELFEDKENQLNRLINSYSKTKMAKETQLLLNDVIKIMNSKPKK
jgi:hypothetical protein